MIRLLKKVFGCGARSFSEKEVPEGSVRVYVGKGDCDLCKFELEVNFLNHPLFENLLQISGEEFGYSYEGALRIACKVDLFQYLVHLLKSSDPSAHYMELPQLVDKFHSTNAPHKIMPL
ncbi:indole-3-acetic acid-induced protein ARG7-like [Punica granatum]|uniref:Uncharacterized protein n=2 Tax=Punica granatum TaxID=22663 RepID=A0A218XLY9_PUNGR|nr:indole-3-acetic acid-induced protein ARG7-like [Punica granatum]OWM85963.1 hypothetical protein CDL15_Pgr012213 [Punica granatum]PKI35725.1 hypothetical protein CRG98_043883 [Punica granatum]